MGRPRWWWGVLCAALIKAGLRLRSWPLSRLSPTHPRISAACLSTDRPGPQLMGKMRRRPGCPAAQLGAGSASLPPAPQPGSSSGFALPPSQAALKTKPRNSASVSKEAGPRPRTSVQELLDGFNT